MVTEICVIKGCLNKRISRSLIFIRGIIVDLDKNLSFSLKICLVRDEKTVTVRLRYLYKVQDIPLTLKPKSPLPLLFWQKFKPLMCAQIPT